jgi:hypothetical protein
MLSINKGKQIDYKVTLTPHTDKQDKEQVLSSLSFCNLSIWQRLGRDLTVYHATQMGNVAPLCDPIQCKFIVKP